MSKVYIILQHFPRAPADVVWVSMDENTSRAKFSELWAECEFHNKWIYEIVEKEIA